MRRYNVCALVMLSLGTWGASCGTPTPGGPDVPATAEQEPNNTLDQPQSVPLSGDAIRVTGRIDAQGDVDLFLLGDVKAGDRLSAEINAAGTTAKISVALIDLFPTTGVATTLGVASGGFGARVDRVLEMTVPADGRYHLGVMRQAGTFDEGVDYDVTVRKQSGVAQPTPTQQTLFLQFNGGSFTAPDGQAVTIGAFDAGAIDPSYAGGTQRAINAIVSTMADNFYGFDVRILSSDRDAAPTGAVSTVYFGPVLTGQGSLVGDGLGVAVGGVDNENLNKSDIAVIFTSSFTPILFGVGTLSPDLLGRALGNVASHEAGHLLGLQHAFDNTDLMHTLDSPATLLKEQRFKRSTLHFFIFDPLGSRLSQDAAGYLDRIVGVTRNGPDFNIDTGKTPFSVALADFDFNGLLDIAVAESQDSTISLFLNEGNRQFGDQLTLDGGGKSLSLNIFDADRNNAPDLLMANPASQNATIIYHLGNGFTFPVTLTAGLRPRESAVGDFNNDGWPDIAFTDFEGGAVNILLNDGAGNFTNIGSIATADGAFGIAAGDFNNDGARDLVVSNYNAETINILLGNGNGGFTVVDSFASGFTPTCVVTADFNRDGLLDFALASSLSTQSLVQFAGSVSIYLGKGNGEFEDPAVYPTDAGTEQLIVVDFNGDGWPDLATANSGDIEIPTSAGNINFLYNQGDGTFGQAFPIEAEIAPCDLAAGDLDGDGRLDLVVVNRSSDKLSIYYGG